MSETRTQPRRKRFSVDALFADTTARGAGVAELVDAKVIQLDRIEPDPDQPRKEFNPETLDELAASIRADGVLQPIAVRYDTARDVYVIVHGERRWRAARIAGIDAVPAIVRDVPEDRRLLQQLVENIVREDLNALDRAAALRALKTRMGDVSWDRVAESVGIRRSRLFQLLGTEKLAEPLQDALRQGLVSEKQTRAVHVLPADTQEELGRQVLDGTLDPRDIEHAARAMRSGSTSRSTARPGSGDRLFTTARKQARQLADGLARIRELDREALNAEGASELVNELRELQSEIDGVIARIDSR